MGNVLGDVAHQTCESIKHCKHEQLFDGQRPEETLPIKHVFIFQTLEALFFAFYYYYCCLFIIIVVFCCRTATSHRANCVNFPTAHPS